tara:strand:+ start:922 stop:1293 length:372 start_codon:yes stop_codon:yes gene_type:complete
MKKELDELFDREINQSVADSFKKLVGFLDATISQSFKLSGDDRAEFLVKNILNVRDFMSSEIIIEKAKLDVRSSVFDIFDKFVKECDLDLEELEQIKSKKKEKDLEEKQLLQESISEIDRSTL